MSRHTKQREASPSAIASSWVDGQLVGAHATVHKRVRTRVMLMSTGSVLLSGIGAYSLSYLEPSLGIGFPLDSFGTALTAVAASLLTVAIMVPVMRRREQWQIKAVSAITHGNVDLLSVLGKLTELRSGETAGHNLRVTLFTLMFAEALQLPPEEIVRVVKGALLHDVGKLAIPDSILGKPGPLTPEESVDMQKHVDYGLEIILQSAILQDAAQVVGGHHERYDGHGYPMGLKGEEIPQGARIFALVDVFDALTSPRVYKPAYSVEESLKIMSSGSGSQFDPDLLARFIELAPDFAQRLPRDEAALTMLLMNRLPPYLERFIPDASEWEAPNAGTATAVSTV